MRFLFSSFPRKREFRASDVRLLLEPRPELVEGRGGDDGRRIRSKSTQALAILFIALALAACGKKAPPSPPPDKPNTFPQPYPKE
jgi:predicted small lipoprotein YifL